MNQFCSPDKLSSVVSLRQYPSQTPPRVPYFLKDFYERLTLKSNGSTLYYLKFAGGAGGPKKLSPQELGVKFSYLKDFNTRAINYFLVVSEIKRRVSLAEPFRIFKKESFNYRFLLELSHVKSS